MQSEFVTTEQFFGRDETLRLLKRRVNALKEGYRQNIALTGQNLAGKSSILHYFLYTFHDNQILPIYVEVSDEPFIYFSHRFIGSLLYNFLKLKGLEPREDLQMLIEEARNYIPHTVKSVIYIQELIKKRDLNEAYSELFDLTSIVKEETGKSCVIILDEFHNLASLKVKHPFKSFGKKIMLQKDTMYIVTSSQVSTVKRILNEKLSLLFGNFEIVRIDGFTTKNASLFLDRRFKYMRVPEEYKDFIISFTEGNPFYLDAISQAVKDIVTGMTFKRIGKDTLIEAFEKTIFSSKGCISQYLNYSLETIRKKGASLVYVSILLAVCNGSYRLKEISKSLKKRSGEISKYASDLIEMNVLYKNGSLYNFVDRMFGFWLRSVYQKKRSAIISYLPDRIRIFNEEISSFIDRFVSEEKKDMAQRVLGLFGAFDNEIVSILDGEYRLPAFSSIEIKSFENGTAYILSEAKKRHWVVSLMADELKDIDIIEFVERCKALKLNIQRRLLIALSGVEMNARLMAKEENVWIWDLEMFNHLMALYGKERIIRPLCQKREKKIA